MIRFKKRWGGVLDYKKKKKKEERAPSAGELVSMQSQKQRDPSVNVGNANEL